MSELGWELVSWALGIGLGRLFSPPRLGKDALRGFWAEGGSMRYPVYFLGLVPGVKGAAAS